MSASLTPPMNIQSIRRIENVNLLDTVVAETVRTHRRRVMTELNGCNLNQCDLA
jgi:hypothetical protein